VHINVARAGVRCSQIHSEIIGKHLHFVIYHSAIKLVIMRALTIMVHFIFQKN
jgi:hypothetical protein